MLRIYTATHNTNNVHDYNHNSTYHRNNHTNYNHWATKANTTLRS